MTVAAVLLALGGITAIGWLIYELVRAPHLTFDEHAATACALLAPDHPDLPDDPELAAAVDALLAELFPTIRRAFPEES
jgi:hypothetical protein